MNIKGWNAFETIEFRPYLYVHRLLLLRDFTQEVHRSIAKALSLPKTTDFEIKKLRDLEQSLDACVQTRSFWPLLGYSSTDELFWKSLALRTQPMFSVVGNPVSNDVSKGQVPISTVLSQKLGAFNLKWESCAYALAEKLGYCSVIECQMNLKASEVKPFHTEWQNQIKAIGEHLFNDGTFGDDDQNVWKGHWYALVDDDCPIEKLPNEIKSRLRLESLQSQDQNGSSRISFYDLTFYIFTTFSQLLSIIEQSADDDIGTFFNSVFSSAVDLQTEKWIATIEHIIDSKDVQSIRSPSFLADFDVASQRFKLSEEWQHLLWTNPVYRALIESRINEDALLPLHLCIPIFTAFDRFFVEHAYPLLIRKDRLRRKVASTYSSTYGSFKPIAF